jgi:phage-related tail protein
MLNIDDWRVMYEAQEQDMAKLRASLYDLEKRHEEAKLSLEVAHNKLGEAQSKLNHLSACNGELIEERNKAKADRDAALDEVRGAQGEER